MKRALVVIVIVIVAAAAAFVYRMSAMQRERQEREQLVNGGDVEVAVPVRVEPVITGEVERVLKYTGTLEPEEQVQVFSKVAGRLIELKVEEGDAVSKDQTVAVIDPEVTGQRFEPFEVTSPIAGKIAHEYLDPGAYINQMEPIVQVINDRYIKVEVGVLEKDYHRVREGTPVRIEVDALPGKVIKARVTNRSPVVDPRTAQAKVEIRVGNREGLLKPGMFARVRVITEVREAAVLMPLSATLTEVLPGRGERAETTVFVANGDRAEARDVVLGLAGPTHYEVLEGLEPGEKVVVTGQNLLRDGMKVSLSGAES
jgi:multidrug efflux pump subunit AcrA (membrane-fusion protein)